MFSTQSDICIPFVHIFDIISLFATEFEKPKIGISGKRLSCCPVRDPVSNSMSQAPIPHSVGKAASCLERALYVVPLESIFFFMCTGRKIIMFKRRKTQYNPLIEFDILVFFFFFPSPPAFF